MYAKLLTLDVFTAPDLVRPFYIAGSVLALLLAGIGVLVGLAAMVQAPLVGLLVVILSGAIGAVLFLAVRLAAETVIAVFRMHARFVGGNPRDPIPN
ncbi:MAG: DUF4282 domain-containing protein [Siculibacillus sp.]